jgi:hypothetical protein
VKKGKLFDTIEEMLGGSQGLVPPKEMAHLVGGGDFKDVGREFLEYLKRLCHLQPNEKVLEGGCGIGRIGGSVNAVFEQGRLLRGF